MNIESLWEQTCALLSRDMPYVSYNTWVEGNMVPGILEDDTMFITVKMDRMISMIQSKYADLIEKRLSEAAGRPMKIVLLGKDEMAERLWNALDANNRISLYVRYVDLKTGAVENRLINKYQK